MFINLLIIRLKRQFTNQLTVLFSEQSDQTLFLTDKSCNLLRYASYGFCGYRIPTTTISSDGENRVVVRLQAGGVLLAPAHLEESLVATPLDAGNPAVDIYFGEATLTTLLRMTSPEVVKKLLADGSDKALKTASVPPGQYRITYSVEGEETEQTVTVEHGEATPVIP